MVRVENDWNIVAPLIGIALWWAYRAIKPTTEPGASPNGGPAEPPDNSGISGGPPSVS
jgi:hypothetical protein